MGAVFIATHVLLDKKFAIKIVRSDYIERNPHALELFTREARTTAAIRHPSVVSITDFGVTQEQVPYLVMEYIAGETLHTFLEDKIPLDFDRLITIFTQVCAGMSKVHHSGIVHRDLKPENILLDRSLPLSSGIKISDFGIAGLFAPEHTVIIDEPESEIIGGTPLFMSPEQWQGNRPIDQRSDIYSLGIILYFAISGSLPFFDKSLKRLGQMHLYKPPTPPVTYNPSIPDSLSKVVLKALEKNPDHRHNTADELIVEMQDSLGLEPGKVSITKPSRDIVLGIDLGTSNSVISVIEKGKPVVIPVDGIERIMPSVVGFRSKSQKIIGSAAFRRAVLDPDHTIVNVKRKMGDSGHRYIIYDSSLTPVEVSSLIIGKLVDSAEQYLGCKVKKAVITVPAYFNEEQRRATKEAGELAGMQVLQLLSEPTAAAISYGMDQNRDQTILVYDLGGGTFDVSILKVKNNDFEVLGVGGDHDLGGNDFDNLLLNQVVSRIKTREKINLWHDKSDKDSIRTWQTLRIAVKKAKEELSETHSTTIDLPNLYKGRSFSLTVTRDEFDELVLPLLEKTTAIVLNTIAEAGIEVDDVDRLLLVGGSTKMPIVKKIISETIREPYIAPNVDEIVSVGAAILGSRLVDTKKTMSLLEVTAHTIGIGMLKEEENEELTVIPVIRKNTRIPTRAYQMAKTAKPRQEEILLPVFRGENQSPADNDYMGELLMCINDPKEEEIPIRILLCINNNGILEVEAAVMQVVDGELLPQPVQTVKAVFDTK
jgi:molecular chaperone DnaK (HSP70)